MWLHHKHSGTTKLGIGRTCRSATHSWGKTSSGARLHDGSLLVLQGTADTVDARRVDPCANLVPSCTCDVERTFLTCHMSPATLTGSMKEGVARAVSEVMDWSILQLFTVWTGEVLAAGSLAEMGSFGAMARHRGFVCMSVRTGLKRQGYEGHGQSQEDASHSCSV